MDERARSEWAEADAAFDRLLDIEPEQRQAALDALGLPPAVHARVERLLTADADCGAALALDRPLARSPVERTLEGQVIDRWRLGPEIGRGGMSVVHAAEAVDRPGRRAALKLLTVGALAADGLERFRREQAILARLSHPHIAPLYDAGIAADGTPWLAMALVDGQRIDAWCRAQALGVEARIRLLLDVCDAVAHAHQALVIHRDLKPGNVMVDANGHVRLLDFGIARLNDASDGERTETTYRALTPDYAAPEQFTGAPPSTAMDVWGIGALAYQLLTGQPPRAAAAVDGSLTRPSRAVAEGHFGDSTLTLRARRIQRGDLDAIVLKALAPDPERRYASVALLAEDLRRWLAGQPVLAQPPTLRYRAGKFVRRHRGAVAAAVIAVLGVLGGLGVSLWQAHRAELAAAEARAQTARAEAAQVRAEAQLRRADSLRDFLTRIFGAVDLDRPSGERPSLDDLLEAGARQAIAATDLDPAVHADMLATIGRVHLLARSPTRGVELLDAAIARGRAAGDAGVVALARALMWRGLADGDRSDEPVDQSPFAEADALLAAGAPDSPLRIEVRRSWSWVRVLQLDFEGALALLEPILDGSWDGPKPSVADRLGLLDSKAMLQNRLGNITAAKDAYDEVIAATRRNGDVRTRSFAIMLANASGTDIKTGALVDAETRVREALAIYAAIGDQPSQYAGSAWIRLGQVLEAQGGFEEAREAYDTGNREWAALRGVEPEDYAYAWSARGLLAATALDDKGTIAALTRFLEIATRRGMSIDGDRALVEAELAGARCGLGDAAGASGLVTARDALAVGAHDRVRAGFAIELAAARCALASGDPAAAIAALDAVATAAPSARGTEARDARAALLRIEALSVTGDAKAAQAIATEAIARLDAAGLGEHPYRGRLHLHLADGQPR
jgi:tetratricopeptide (TPR) repeat protein